MNLTHHDLDYYPISKDKTPICVIGLMVVNIVFLDV